jgi:CRP/FNR family transcriptional regulator, nitrogen oxide reductase regulator
MSETIATLDLAPSGIQNAALFGGLSPEELNLVISRASLKAVPLGVSVFRQAEPAKEMFLLESGRVRLHEITADGHELLIRFVRPGEVFGDKGAIPGSQYRASAGSDTPVRIYAWTTAAMVTLIEELPRLATNLFKIATQYSHYSRERYLLLATASAEDRIRWAVAELARSFGSSQANATAITGRAVQQDIADLSATTIYTVSRVLKGYEQKGVLSKKRGRILLFRSFQ